MREEGGADLRRWQTGWRVPDGASGSREVTTETVNDYNRLILDFLAINTDLLSK